MGADATSGCPAPGESELRGVVWMVHRTKRLNSLSFQGDCMLETEAETTKDIRGLVESPHMQVSPHPYAALCTVSERGVGSWGEVPTRGTRQCLEASPRSPLGGATVPGGWRSEESHSTAPPTKNCLVPKC